MAKSIRPKNKSADKYVLSLPMWNFSIPYRLKQYIDILVQPGYTFSVGENGYEGLVKNKPVLVVYARGGAFPEGSGMEAFDMQKKYMELLLFRKAAGWKLLTCRKNIWSCSLDSSVLRISNPLSLGQLCRASQVIFRQCWMLLFRRPDLSPAIFNQDRRWN
jgi:hypothetical protein